jgi:cystathionine beta-lyase
VQPHNPGGTVFTREELLAIDAIAERHNLVICSDEIHCDLLLDKDARHIPYGALSPEAAERSAVMMAPSKTFNIAGLCCSFAVIPMPACGSSCNRRCAASAPTSICWGSWRPRRPMRGEQWLNEQLDYLAGNLALIEQAVARWPGVKLARNQATYLAWIDMSALGWTIPSPSSNRRAWVSPRSPVRQRPVRAPQLWLHPGPSHRGPGPHGESHSPDPLANRPGRRPQAARCAQKR